MNNSLFISCICGGTIELTIAFILGITGSLGLLFNKKNKIKHGVHGDEECDCECHHKN